MVFVLRLRSWDLSWTWRIGHNYLNKQGSRKVEHIPLLTACLSTQNVQPPLDISQLTSPLCHYSVSTSTRAQGRNGMKAGREEHRQVHGRLDVLAGEADFGRCGGRECWKSYIDSHTWHTLSAYFGLFSGLGYENRKGKKHNTGFFLQRFWKENQNQNQKQTNKKHKLA